MGWLQGWPDDVPPAHQGRISGCWEAENLKTFQAKAQKPLSFHVPFLLSTPPLITRSDLQAGVTWWCGELQIEQRGWAGQKGLHWSHQPPAKVNRQYYREELLVAGSDPWRCRKWKCAMRHRVFQDSSPPARTWQKVSGTELLHPAGINGAGPWSPCQPSSFLWCFRDCSLSKRLQRHPTCAAYPFASRSLGFLHSYARLSRWSRTPHNVGVEDVMSCVISAFCASLSTSDKPVLSSIPKQLAGPYACEELCNPWAKGQSIEKL